MQREPGKRDYGTSDCARVRSLASRGISEPQPAPPPRRISHTERPRPQPRREDASMPKSHAPA